MPKAIARTLTALGLTLCIGAGVVAQEIIPPVAEQGLAGAYLAARVAAIDGNHRVAAEFFERALAADPDNETLITNAVFAHAAMGEWDQAAEIAARLPTTAQQGRDIAQLALFVDLVRRGDLAAARTAINNGVGVGAVIDALVIGWLYLDSGDMRRATQTFQQIVDNETNASIALIHLALLRAAVGDFEGANTILAGDEFGPVPMTTRVVRARAEILAQLNQQAEAAALLSQYIETVPSPGLLALKSRLETQIDPDPYDFVVTPEQGIAEVFFTIATALVGAEGGAAGALPLLYAQVARGIDPDHAEATMFAAQILEQGRQYQLAAETFAVVDPRDDEYVAAQLGRANALFDDDAETAAMDILRDLAALHPNQATVHSALGDMLRRTEQCGQAISAYTRALDLMDINTRGAWGLFYTRAICNEREGNWPPAEADFRMALTLNPGQPNVLNYLGYSLVEQRRNLDEALDMIERAAEARPNSGFIADSLGWVFYRLGRFDDAVAPMERAVELEPNDPIINDHLGDVYWMVGRRREAEFQWRRALSFEPTAEDATRIRLKLDLGLDAVLENEGGVGEIQ